MGPPLWVHCNYCYYLFTKKDRKFYQTSCLHIICRNCSAHSNRGQLCPICKRQGIKFHEIGNEMDQKDKALYNPAPLKPVETASKTVMFQRKQKKHLAVQLEATEEKLRKLCKMEQEARTKIVDYQRKFDKVREKRKSVQDIIRQQRSRGLSPDSAELLLLQSQVKVRPPTQGKSTSSSSGGEDFFDSDRQSRRSVGSCRSRDSFLDIHRKGSPTSDSPSPVAPSTLAQHPKVSRRRVASASNSTGCRFTSSMTTISHIRDEEL